MAHYKGRLASRWASRGSWPPPRVVGVEPGSGASDDREAAGGAPATRSPQPATCPSPATARLLGACTHGPAGLSPAFTVPLTGCPSRAGLAGRRCLTRARSQVAYAWGSCLHALPGSHTPGPRGAGVHAAVAFSSPCLQLPSCAWSPPPWRCAPRKLIKDTSPSPDGNSWGGCGCLCGERPRVGAKGRCDIFSGSQAALGFVVPLGQRNTSGRVRSPDLPGPASGRLQGGPGGPGGLGRAAPNPRRLGSRGRSDALRRGRRPEPGLCAQPVQSLQPWFLFTPEDEFWGADGKGTVVRNTYNRGQSGPMSE